MIHFFYSLTVHIFFNLRNHLPPFPPLRGKVGQLCKKTRVLCLSIILLVLFTYFFPVLGERCEWVERQGQLAGSSLYDYSTCVTNTACGDASCDPLERLEPAICPQDCANFSGIQYSTVLFQ